MELKLAQKPSLSQFSPAPAGLQPPWGNSSPPATSALYLHIPFCFHKCHYCDFYSIVDDQDRQAVFTQRLIVELQLRVKQLPLQPRTIFIGGGTPTLLGQPLWEQLLTAMHTLGLLSRVREFTVEANPETVTPELARTLVAGGVNRISMGAQSFDPQALHTLERWHDPASVRRAVAWVREAGIDNINLDLIFAIPGQTLASLDADLSQALALEPTHLSYYGLTFEPHTALSIRQTQGRIVPVDEDLQRAMYEHLMKALEAAGFEHYEVSAWAKRAPGQTTGEMSSRRCQHNLAYWRNENWLGIGPAAGSHMAGLRWRNEPHLGRYLAAVGEPPVQDVERLPAERQAGEMLMLGLRLREGIPLLKVRAALPPDDARWAVIGELENIDMIEVQEDHLRLTPRGLLVADAVLAKLL